MKDYKKLLYYPAYILLAVLLILEKDSVAVAVQESVTLCLMTVLPSLLPFCALTYYFSNKLNASSFLCLGLLGGYPVGTQAVCNACRSGAISKEEAGRMLGYVNNPGPAFVFGICGQFFSDVRVPLTMWLIQAISAIALSMLLPGKKRIQARKTTGKSISFQDIALYTLRAMGSICFWITMFRIVITLMEKWILHHTASVLSAILTGLLELTNGCISGGAISNESIRFMVLNGLLTFGGLCVAFQVLSLSGDIGPGMYFPGKLMQVSVSFLLSYSAQLILFPRPVILSAGYLVIPAAIFILPYCLKKLKIAMENRKRLLYNKQKI